MEKQVFSCSRKPALLYRKQWMNPLFLHVCRMWALLTSNHSQFRKLWKTIPKLPTEAVPTCRMIPSSFGYWWGLLLIPENLERIQGTQTGFPSAKMKKPEFISPDWKIKRCLAAQIASPLLCTKLALAIFIWLWNGEKLVQSLKYCLLGIQLKRNSIKFVKLTHLEMSMTC